jgi:hypothetical protein
MVLSYLLLILMLHHDATTSSLPVLTLRRDATIVFIAHPDTTVVFMTHPDSVL